LRKRGEREEVAGGRRKSMREGEEKDLGTDSSYQYNTKYTQNKMISLFCTDVIV
jgi:hypothetical protein